MAVNHKYIDATPAQVFAVLSDGWAYSNWVVGASHMRAVESAWPAVGSRLFHASGPWPATLRDDTVVEVCEPDRRLELTARGRPFGTATVTLELAADDGGCLVTMTEEPTGGLGAVTPGPLVDPVLHRRNAESLDRLAAISERRQAPVD